MNSTSFPTAEQLIGYSPAELAKVDPVVLNLSVAKGIPAFADLEISKYIELADEWADDLKKRLKKKIIDFQRIPERWRNDVNFFKLGVVCWYMDCVLGMAYREDQRDAQLAGVRGVHYTDPNDLFIHGIMDTRRGTCGNIAAFYVVLARRIGLPVSLAYAGSHLYARYDDGFGLHYNIETTDLGRGGYCSPADEEIRTHYKLPTISQTCGSDLVGLSFRQMLGVFLGLRGRHFSDSRTVPNDPLILRMEVDFLLARALFPESRILYLIQNEVSVQQSLNMFVDGEKGHPTELIYWLYDVLRYIKPKNPQPQTEKKHVRTPPWRPQTITVSAKLR